MQKASTRKTIILGESRKPRYKSAKEAQKSVAQDRVLFATSSEKPLQIAEHALAEIVRVIASIPSGRVLSYGAVANKAGVPRGARQVVRALRIPQDVELPWQRVIRSDGSCAVPGQLERLEAEGVKFKNGKVLANFWWSQLASSDLADESAGVQVKNALERAIWEF